MVVVLVVVYDMVISLAAVGNFQKTGPAVYSYKRYSKRREDPPPFYHTYFGTRMCELCCNCGSLDPRIGSTGESQGSDTNDISKTWLPQWKYD